jgi:hypothetical protein
MPVVRAATALWPAEMGKIEALQRPVSLMARTLRVVADGNQHSPEVTPMKQPPSIPDMVTAALAELGIAIPSPLTRTFLLRDRHFVGQKYRFEGGYAIWLAETGVVKVYKDDGSLLEALVTETANEEKAA